MVPSSYLRIYQELESFEANERARWDDYIEKGKAPPLSGHYRQVAFDETSGIGVLHPPTTSDHAYVKKLNGKWYVCPLRTRLRVLVGLLAYRNSLPNDFVDSFVPEEEAEKAIRELEELRDREPRLLSNINTSTWHVPLRWFTAFEDGERQLAEMDGSSSIVYQTDLVTGIARIERAIDIMSRAGLAEEIVEPVDNLLAWMKEFPGTSLLELDYGTIVQLFSAEELVFDRSAGEVWSCLEALEDGDFEESGRIYTELASWWGRVRSLESAN
ncbi:MAG: hypothetical protein KY429_01045 [Actinobacteria bacterium]|nr:hypothetical protein [Actinomycetota bacterium]